MTSVAAVAPAAVSLLSHVIYINLDSRIDRCIHVLGEFKKIGVTHAVRFPAIQMKNGNGALGCTFSHIKCLEMAIANDWPWVFIAEDDIQFTRPDVLLESLGKFTSYYGELESVSDGEPLWDVLLVAGNNVPPYQQVEGAGCVRIQNCQVAAGYIVRKHYYSALLENFKTGCGLFMRAGQPDAGVSNPYAIDMYWKQLQKVHRWFLLTPLTVTQVPSYSDIEKREVDYTQVMLDLDKPWLFGGAAAGGGGALKSFSMGFRR